QHGAAQGGAGRRRQHRREALLGLADALHRQHDPQPVASCLPTPHRGHGTASAVVLAEAGDADTGVALVGAVDVDDDGRQRLGGGGIGDGAGVEAAHAHGLHQLDDLLAGLLAVPGHQHVAVEAVPLLEVVGGDILEGGNDHHPLPQQLLGGGAGGALGGQLHGTHLGGHQGHGDVDENLALEGGPDGFEGGFVVGEGHRQHDDIGGAGGGEVLHGPHPQVALAALGHHRLEVLEGLVGLVLGAGADDDRIPRGAPAAGEASAEGTRAANDRDNFV